MSGIAIPGPFEELRICSPLFVSEAGEQSVAVPEGGCDAVRPTRVFAGDTAVSGSTCTLTARMQASGCETLFDGNTRGFANRAGFWHFAIPRDELRNVRFGVVTPVYTDEGVTRQLVLPEVGEWFPGPNTASASIDYEVAVIEDGETIASTWERMLDQSFEAVEGDDAEGFDQEFRFRRVTLRDPIAFFPSGDSDVVIRVTLVMTVRATGPVNRSVMGRTLADTDAGSRGVAEATLTPQVQCAYGYADALRRLKRPIEVPAEALEQFLELGVPARPRSPED